MRRQWFCCDCLIQIRAHVPADIHALRCDLLVDAMFMTCCAVHELLSQPLRTHDIVTSRRGRALLQQQSDSPLLPTLSTESFIDVLPAVGILAAQCAFARGASRVIIIDEHAYRLQRAQEVGTGSWTCATPARHCSPSGLTAAHTNTLYCMSLTTAFLQVRPTRYKRRH